MIVTIDTETQGLNAQRFLLGCICHEDLTTETFRSNATMWTRLNELGEKARKARRTLLIYAHNLRYDFLAIRPTALPTNYTIYSTNPYLVDVRDPDDEPKRPWEEPRAYMKWLDTTALWRGDLRSMGDTLGTPKGTTPEWLTKDTYAPTEEELQEATTYMEQDARICMTYLHRLRCFLNRHGIKPRHLITSNQVGMNALLAHLKKAENKHAFLADNYRTKLWRTRYPERIREACRGGRVHAHQYGRFDHATVLDINSSYPASLATIRTPDLRTETLITEPLTHGWQRDELYATIGISNATLRITREQPYGVLPVRTDGDNHYPTHEGSILIGTWTHDELAAATTRGYETLWIRWSILWEETPNPFHDLITTLYDARKAATEPLEQHFLKMLMNGATGKFSQRRELFEAVWDDADHADQYPGWERVDYNGHQTLYRRKTGHVRYPRHYAPILYALITSDARLRLLREMEKLAPQDLYYTDTDSIVCNTAAVTTEKYKYDTQLGGLKREHDDAPLLIYAKKSYMIGDQVKLSGVGKHWITPDAFRDGHITYRRMNDENGDPTTRGTFSTEERNLHDSTAAAQEQDERLAHQRLFIDDETDGQPHLETLKRHHAWSTATTDSTPSSPSSQASSSRTSAGAGSTASSAAPPTARR